MKKQRCIILIDGSNFYFKLKDLRLQRLLEFDFSSFSKYLARNCEIKDSIYYIGAVRTDGTEKTFKLFKAQRKLLMHLKRNKFKYSLGYLLKSDGKFREKGVDVNIAVDILVAAYENLCDTVILVSSDTDLLPAVKKAKEKNKKIEYVGFSHQPSVAMVANCSTSRLLTKYDLMPFTLGNKRRGK
ncbi:NYN domain-containing protein [Candidatus Curtissbacteria bacterium]|nr:NYN domain-containing protein [Candidatus Curtissbacteria bacterium]